jgi:uncharacterized BrkB/YihY/UPF0761 family membrane protein
VDELQQRRAWLAFPVAVWKKFGDDQAGNLAALVAYYAFVSIFPLLLVLVTVLSIALKHNPDLQAVGGYFISHQLANTSDTYGTFAVVLGLLAFLYLEAELTLYAVEINVVHEYRLWPRSVAPPPYTEQDQRAFELYAQVEKRGKGEDILVKVEGEDDREKTG